MGRRERRRRKGRAWGTPVCPWSKREKGREAEKRGERRKTTERACVSPLSPPPSHPSLRSTSEPGRPSRPSSGGHGQSWQGPRAAEGEKNRPQGHGGCGLTFSTPSPPLLSFPLCGAGSPRQRSLPLWLRVAWRSAGRAWWRRLSGGSGRAGGGGAAGPRRGEARVRGAVVRMRALRRCAGLLFSFSFCVQLWAGLAVPVGGGGAGGGGGDGWRRKGGGG